MTRKKNLLLVGRDTGPEDILATRLYHLMTQKVNKKHWSAKLTPEEGLYFARILDAHALVSFTSDVHKEYRDTPLVFDSLKTMASADIRATLSSFEDTYNATHDYREAQKSAFLAALQHRGKDAKRDQEFFKWYGTQLKAKTDLSISLCVDFSSGNLGPCFVTQDTAPSNDMGQSVLGAETLMNISASHHSGGAYITAREAEEILQTMRSQEVVHGQKMLAGLHTELKKCCDGSRNNSLIGLGVLRGRFGLSLF